MLFNNGTWNSFFANCQTKEKMGCWFSTCSAIVVHFNNFFNETPPPPARASSGAIMACLQLLTTQLGRQKHLPLKVRERPIESPM